MERISQSGHAWSVTGMGYESASQTKQDVDKEKSEQDNSEKFPTGSNRQWQANLLKQAGQTMEGFASKRVKISASDELPHVENSTNGREADVTASSATTVQKRREKKQAAKIDPAIIAAQARAQEDLKQLIDEAGKTTDTERMREIVENVGDSDNFKVLWALARNDNVTPEIAAMLVKRARGNLPRILDCFEYRLPIINDERFFNEVMSRYRYCSGAHFKPLAGVWLNYIHCNPVNIRHDLLEKVSTRFKIYNYPELLSKIEQYTKQSSDARSTGHNPVDFITSFETRSYRDKGELLKAVWPSIRNEVEKDIPPPVEESMKQVDGIWKNLEQKKEPSWRQCQLWLHPDKNPGNSEHSAIVKTLFVAANGWMNEQRAGALTMAELYDSLP